MVEPLSVFVSRARLGGIKFWIATCISCSPCTDSCNTELKHVSPTGKHYDNTFQKKLTTSIFFICLKPYDYTNIIKQFSYSFLPVITTSTYSDDVKFPSITLKYHTITIFVIASTTQVSHSYHQVPYKVLHA
jgi:hypothetical protein